MKKTNYLIIFIALLITLTSVAVAADVDDTTADSVTTPTITQDVTKNVDTQKAVKDISNEDNNKNTQQTTKKVVQTENNGQTRNTTPTIWNVSNANFSNIVTSNGLSSSVNDGDVLNFVSDVTRTGSSYIIDKPVTILGNQYTLNLNTGLNYAKTSLNFVNGASNSNITGLNLLNTQVYVNTSSNITFDNIHAKVNNSGVGAGVGSFAIRDGSINVTVKNSYFETYSNGGYSTLVLTWAKNCTIENNTVYGTGNVGNLVYLNNYGGKVNANGIVNNSGNTIKDNTITAVDPGMFCYALTITGANNSIINNTISNNKNYSVTTSWAGSYEETNPGDTHNVSYHGNKYINNTISGKFSTGNYSIVEGNWINGTSTIVGHANVTNNTFLDTVTIRNNVKFHSNNATGQTVIVNLPDSCFKNSTIGTLHLEDSARFTYNCGENSITSYYNKKHFKPCNGNCPNCESSKSSLLSKKYVKSLKMDSTEILYQDDSCVVYSNGTAIVNESSCENDYVHLKSKFSNTNLNNLDGVTEVYLYLNSINWLRDIKNFDVDLGKNKSNIDLKIIFNTTGDTLNQGFNFSDMGYKFVTYENCNFLKPKEKAEWNILESWGFHSNLKFINCKFDFQSNGRYNPNSAMFYLTELYDGDGWDMGESVNCMSIVGENITFEKCVFNLQTHFPDIYEEEPEYSTWTNIIVFNNSSNVTFNNNSFTISTLESSLDKNVSLYGPFLNRTVNNLKFINNDVNIRFVPGIKLKTNNSLFENNTITVQHADKTIELTGDNNIVRYNTLTSKSGEGDSTVVVTGENNVVEQNPYVEEPSVIDYYVSDADGSDDNDGSISSPFKTIKTAIDKTDDFNTFNIHILEGIYKGVGNTNLTVPGTNNINFIGAGINKTFIDGEAKFTIPGEGSVWGGSGFWNVWSNTSGNWVMNISAGEGLININNLTIQNSWASSGSSIKATTPTIDNHATLNVSNVYFYSNHAGNGAGIRNNYDGTLYVDNCVFENNTKSSTTGNYGAAVYNNGTAILTNSQIVRNFARWGSVTNDKNITLINCTFEGNGAYDGGSGYKNGPSFAADTGITNMYMMYGVFNLSSTIINCTFNDNQQCDISNGRGDLIVDNCVFNHSTGIYLFPNTNRLNTYIPTQNITNNVFIDMQPSTVFATLISSTTPSVAVRSLSPYPVLIKNNEINVPDVDYGYGLYLTSNATVINNTLNNYIYVANKENTITGNVITTDKENTISLANAAANVTITDNTLYGGYTAGDLSVGNVLETTTLENNKPETNTYEINDDNYATYFDENSVLKTDVISNGSKITFVNNLTNKKFIFDNVKVAVDVNTTLINTTIVTENNAHVLFNNLKISNAKTDEDYVILFDSENNIIKNGNINVTTDKPVQVIKVEEDDNIITGTTINATIPASDVVWNSDYSIGNVPTAAVFIRSSNNKLNSSRIYVYSTSAVQGASNPTVDGVDIQSKKVGEYVTGNEIRSTRINVTGGSYVYGLNIARAKDTITPLSYFTVSSTNYGAAIQIGDSNDNNISGYIYSEADAVAYGLYSTAMASGISNNNNYSKLYLQEVRAPDATGILLEGASNVELSSATYNIYGENVTGINIVSDYMGNTPENIKINALTINLNGESNTSSMINTRNAANVNITKNSIKSTSGNGIILENTTSSTVTNNYINAANIHGGDDAVDTDIENTIFNNTPKIAVLTDDTYSDFFDENNTLKVDVGVISLGGDLHDKILIINNHTQVINITNTDNYTMYNSTIIIEGNGTYSDRYGFTVEGINFNNTNKPVFIDRFNGTGQKNVKFVNDNIYITGEDIVAFDALNNESYIYLDISESNIEMDGTNVTAINYAGYNRGQPAYITDNNITLKATSKAVAFNAENATIKFNKNNVEINAPNVVVANLMNTSISYYNFDENIIKVNATDAMVINMTKGDTYYAYIKDNEINVTTKNPSTLIDITGPRTIYVQNNVIILNATNGETPVIRVNNPSSSVKNNFVMSNDLYGPEAVNATSQSDNTPIRTTTELTAPEEAKVFDEITINVTVTNATTSSDGILVLKINDEIVANTTENTITYNYKPETNDTLNVVAEYMYENTGFISSTANTTITVNKVDTTLTLNTNRPYLDENLTISGTLTDEYDEPINNTQLTITVNNETVNITTDSEGKYNYTTSPVEGNNTITVSFNGENSYESKEQTKSFIVIDLEKYAMIDELNKTVKQLNDTVNNQTETIGKLNDTINNQTAAIENLETTIDELKDVINNLTSTKPTTITFDAIKSAKVGDKITISGQLSDENGYGIPGTIKLLINNGRATIKTNVNGVFTYEYTVTKVGTYNVTASYLGTKTYDPSNNTMSFDVAQQNTNIIIDDITPVKTGSNVTVTGKLVDANGNPIKGTIKLLINNGRATVKTDADGVFTYTFVASKVGVNNISASYLESTKYLATNTTATVKVTAMNTQIVLDKIANAKKGEKITISGKLLDENGNAITGTIKLLINNGRATVKTDENGIFTYEYTVTKVGENNITASYLGANRYAATEATTTAQVEKLATTITLNNIGTVTQKTMVKISGKLADENGKAVTGTIKLLINNGRKTIKTDNTGAFTYSHNATWAGQNTITATYLESTNYLPTNSTTTFTVTKA